MATLAKIAADNYNVNKAIYDPNEVYKNWWNNGYIKNGNALQFDRVNDFILRSNMFDKLNGTCTFGFWFKRLGICSVPLANSTAGLSYIGPLGNTNGFRYKWYNGSQVDITYAPTFATGTWYSLIVSKTTTNTKIFINGVEIYNGAYTNTNVTSGIDLGIFTTFGSGGVVIDQLFSVPNVEITATEALALYNGGNGDYVSTTIGTPNMLINFNQNSPDSIATDESGNGYDFTLNNFDTATCWVAH